MRHPMQPRKGPVRRVTLPPPSLGSANWDHSGGLNYSFNLGSPLVERLAFLGLKFVKIVMFRLWVAQRCDVIERAVANLLRNSHPARRELHVRRKSCGVGVSCCQVFAVGPFKFLAKRTIATVNVCLSIGPPRPRRVGNRNSLSPLSSIALLMVSTARGASGIKWSRLFFARSPGTSHAACSGLSRS